MPVASRTLLALAAVLSAALGTTPAPNSGVTIIESLTYLGCYSTVNTSLDLGKTRYLGAPKTPGGCRAICMQNFMDAVQYVTLYYTAPPPQKYERCRCGTLRPPESARLPDASCTTCPDHECGGTDAMSLYSAVAMTAGPDTPQPMTSQPDTPEPVGPATPLPPTDVPATDAPPSEAPTLVPANETEPLPDVLPNRQALENTVAVAGITAAVASGPAAIGAARLLVSSEACVVEGADTTTSWLLHPTGWEPDHNQAAGIVLANLSIFAGALLLAFLVHYPISWVAPSIFPVFFYPGFDYIGFTRFPSVPLFVFFFLYQGTALGAMTLVLHAYAWAWRLMGFAASAVCICIPLVLYRELKRSVPRKGVFVRDKVCKNKVLRWLTGPGEWCSTRRNPDWVNRYTFLVRYYRERYSWFCTVDFGTAFLVAAAQSIRTNTMEGCGHVKAFTAIVFGVQLMVEACYWPHCRYRDSAMDFILLALQFCAMFLMATGYYAGDRNHWAFATASSLLLVAALGYVLKFVADLLSEIYVLLSGRRDRLQDAYFAAQESDQATEELDDKNAIVMCAADPSEMDESDHIHHSASHHLHRQQPPGAAAGSHHHLPTHPNQHTALQLSNPHPHPHRATPLPQSPLTEASDPVRSADDGYDDENSDLDGTRNSSVHHAGPGGSPPSSATGRKRAPSRKLAGTYTKMSHDVTENDGDYKPRGSVTPLKDTGSIVDGLGAHGIVRLPTAGSVGGGSSGGNASVTSLRRIGSGQGLASSESNLGLPRSSFARQRALSGVRSSSTQASSPHSETHFTAPLMSRTVSGTGIGQLRRKASTVFPNTGSATPRGVSPVSTRLDRHSSALEAPGNEDASNDWQVTRAELPSGRMQRNPSGKRLTNRLGSLVSTVRKDG